MPEIVFIGGGGHALVLLDALRASGNTRSAGVLDQRLVGTKVLDAPVLGGDELLDDCVASGARFFVIAVGGVGDNRPRARLFDRAAAAGLEPLTIIHPAAVVSSHARLGRGVQILAGAIINAGAAVEEHAIVNTAAIIEHDCRIGRHAHVATGARLASTVMVGDYAHVGAGATVRQLIEIGEGAVVGAGAVVVKNVPAATTVAGVPAKELR